MEELTAFIVKLHLAGKAAVGKDEVKIGAVPSPSYDHPPPDVPEYDEKGGNPDFVANVGQDIARAVHSIDRQGFNAGSKILDICHSSIRALGAALHKAHDSREVDQLIDKSELKRLAKVKSLLGWTLLHVVVDIGHAALTSAVIRAGSMDVFE
jgi:hypothetical protein